jgi:ABC-type nitrate/sulfonate/bicarbonate transport system substrate-binding protein
MRQGYFAARGLAVELSFTAGSAAQLAGLARGDYQLIQTAPDNVIHVDTQPAAFALDAAAAPHVVMVLGGSVGPLTVYARRGVSNVAGLRGATLGVDNPVSGFAIVLRDLLQREGLALDRDYAFEVAGGTHARCDALVAAAVAGTILYSPFDLRAAEQGCTALGSSAAAYRAYASGSTAGLQLWIEAHGETVTRYIEAVLQALRWLYDPTHAQEVQSLMRSEPALGVAADLVPRAYAAFVAPASGFGREAAIDEQGLGQVITLRATYGPQGVRLRQPAEYCDPRWYRAALARLPPEASTLARPRRWSFAWGERARGEGRDRKRYVWAYPRRIRDQIRRAVTMNSGDMCRGVYPSLGERARRREERSLHGTGESSAASAGVRPVARR